MNKLNQDELNGIIRFMDSWYFDNIPEIETREFFRFVLESKDTIFKSIIGNKNVELKTTKHIATAYTDLIDIYLPIVGFIVDFYINVYQIEIEDKYTATRIAVAVLNYMMIHEALHIHYTETLFYKFADDCKAYYSDKETKVIVNIRQIVEDLFIEHQCSLDFVSHYRFVDIGHRIIFNKTLQDFVLEKLDEQVNYLTLTNYFTTYKSTYFENDHPFDKMLVQYVDKARNTKTDNDRNNLSIQIFEFFKKLIEEENEEELSEEEAFGESGEEETPYGLTDDFEKVQADNTGDGSETTAGSTEEEANEEFDSVKREKRTEEEEIKRLEEIQNRDSKKNVRVEHEAEYVDISNYKFVDMPNLRGIHRFLSFASAPKKNHNVLKEKGRRLVKNKLYRIATDNKIFDDKKQEVSRREKPEVILLCDVSGSTDSYVGGGFNLRDYIVSAAREVYITLLKAGFASSVYAHTTSNFDNSLVFPIAANNMPFGEEGYKRHVNPTKMFAFAAEGIDNWGNADAIAVNYCSKKFTAKKNTKVLIVISDGLPTESVSGNHTEELKDVIRIARQNGIKIFSLSVAKGVVKNNNKIYGEQFNIAASDPRTIDKEMSKFLKCLMDI